MDSIGTLKESQGRFEFSYDPLGLVIRGNYAEWVLEAAAEVIARIDKLQFEGRIDELMTLHEFGDAHEIEVDAAKMDAKSRFEVIPQCVVTMGALDYKWVSPDGRTAETDPPKDQPMRRIHDMSMTRTGSFLKDEADPDAN